MTLATTKAHELALTPGTWSIDTIHSNVEFVARHLMVSKVRGHFQKFSGSVKIAEDLSQSTVEATIEVASVSTNEPSRDAHLLSADFFDAENYPNITFVSKAIKPGDKNYVLEGDLTIRGNTKTIELKLEFNGVGPDSYGGKRAGFSAATEVSRKEFGLEWNALLETGGLVVSDTVLLSLEIELIAQ